VLDTGVFRWSTRYNTRCPAAAPDFVPNHSAPEGPRSDGHEVDQNDPGIQRPFPGRCRLISERGGGATMTQSPEPIEVQKYLSGMNYPATKEQIVNNAKTQGAPEEVMESLEQIPEQEYDGPNKVSQAVSRT
jgi:hypothetical protein